MARYVNKNKVAIFNKDARIPAILITHDKNVTTIHQGTGFVDIGPDNLEYVIKILTGIRNIQHRQSKPRKK